MIKKEEVKVVANPLVNFKPIHIEEDIPEGPMAKCCNCGKDRPIKTMCYGNLDNGRKAYLCWSCNGSPYIHCRGIAGCPDGGCIHLWEDMEYLNNKVNWKDIYITGAECVSFECTEICKKKLYELMESGKAFQCSKCSLYYVKGLTAKEYFGETGTDDLCAVCYNEEQKNMEGKGEELRLAEYIIIR